MLLRKKSRKAEATGITHEAKQAVAQEPAAMKDGLLTVTIDNTQSSISYIKKLVSLISCPPDVFEYGTFCFSQSLPPPSPTQGECCWHINI